MNFSEAFLVAFFIGLIAVIVLKKVSERTGFLVDVARGDALKIHSKNIPLVGGLAMASSILGSFFIFKEQSIFMVAGLLAIFFLGFYDDAAWKHVAHAKPILKFSFLITSTLFAGAMVFYGGISLHFLPLAAAAVLTNAIYIFICINAVNYQDGMDGLAGTLAFISLAGFAVLGAILGNNVTAMLSLISLGAVTSFLIFNFPPAKVFMGDSGAYSLGFILAVLAISASGAPSIYSVIGSMLIIGLPLIDGVFTNIRRLAKGKSIFLGDRAHFYDKLLTRGFSVKKTLFICAGIQCVLVVAGLLIYANTIIKT